MKMPVFIGSAFCAQYPEGGGIYWLPLQYLLGLRELGYEAYWLECFWTRGDAAADRVCIDAFLGYARELGIADQTILLYVPEGGRDDPEPARVELHGPAAGALASRRGDALLLNMAHSVTRPLRDGFARTVLFDVDPGTFQLWAHEWDMGVGSHDAYLTIGMNLGAPDSPIPLHGIPWKKVWPSIHLPSWPVQAAPGRAYSTVTQWWSQQYAFLDGDTYDCNKRTSFMEFLDVPRRAVVPVTLAANLSEGETADKAALAEHGWTLVDPHDVCATPSAFRRFVQTARGEFSCAKPAYVKARAGWISDRTLCYLASGLPCVVQETGVRSHLPSSAGLRFFSTTEEAVEALHAVEADLPAAARAARALAEEVFATRVVLPQLLAAVTA